MKGLSTLKENSIIDKIYIIRHCHVMFDSDLSELYQIETKNLNKAVKRNINRFPPRFMFQLTAEEWKNLRFQFGTSSFKYGGRRYLPYVFTEQGVAMLSAIINSSIAINVSIQIIDAFVEMRKILNISGDLFKRIDRIESKQAITDHNFEKIFKALDDKSQKISQGIFYEGQIFDSYKLISDIGSGINFKRQGLITILDSCLQNNIGEVVIAHKDRLSRFGFDLIKLIIEKAGGKITIINDEQNKSTEQELAEDLLSIIHIYSCRQMGKRKYTNTKN